MRRLAAICVALVVAAAAPRGPDPLAKAKALLDAGDFEKVLDEANLARGAKPAELAAVLGKAAALAFDKGDRWMAALYCERALAAHATERTALEICLRSSLADERYEDSIRYGDVLGKLSPKDPQVALWRAKAALGEGEPGKAKALLAPHARGPLAAQVAPMLSQAEEDIVKARQEGGRQKDLEAKLAKAVSEARALGRAADAEERPSASGASGEVVLYTTAWCGVCKRAKAWLKSKRIDFLEKDLEKDSDAQQELAHKCARAGVRANGVPVLDARGKLLVGFDAGSYQSALR